MKKIPRIEYLLQFFLFLTLKPDKMHDTQKYICLYVTSDESVQSFLTKYKQHKAFLDHMMRFIQVNRILGTESGSNNRSGTFQDEVFFLESFVQ